jgi:hypothetical protein
VTARLVREIELLRQRFPKLRHDGRWILLPDYALPAGWNRPATDVAFQIQEVHPGTPPYGIYVPSGIRYNGALPQSYTEPASTRPPFAGDWGVFSWQADDGAWRPTDDVVSGANLLNWALGFQSRFTQGA